MNAFTQRVAALQALFGAAVQVVLAALGGNPWRVVSVSICGPTLLLPCALMVL